MGTMVIKSRKTGTPESEVTRAPAPLFKVMLLNDDFTPMDFVVTVVQKYFLWIANATRVMLKVPERAWGYAASFLGHRIATTKVEQVTSFARQHQHPLACVMEEN